MCTIWFEFALFFLLFLPYTDLGLNFTTEPKLTAKTSWKIVFLTNQLFDLIAAPHKHQSQHKEGAFWSMVSHAKFNEYNRRVWVTSSHSYFCADWNTANQILFIAHKNLTFFFLIEMKLTFFKLNVSFQAEDDKNYNWPGYSDHQPPALLCSFFSFWPLFFSSHMPSLQGCLIPRRPTFLPLTVILLTWKYLLW